MVEATLYSFIAALATVVWYCWWPTLPRDSLFTSAWLTGFFWNFIGNGWIEGYSWHNAKTTKMHGAVTFCMLAGTASPQLFFSHSHLELLFLFCLLLWAVALLACPGLLCLRHESLEEEEARVQKHHLENTDDLIRERRKPCLVSNEYLNYLIISFLRKKHFWVELCAQTAWLWIPQ